MDNHIVIITYMINKEITHEVVYHFAASMVGSKFRDGTLHHIVNVFWDGSDVIIVHKTWVKHRRAWLYMAEKFRLFTIRFKSGAKWVAGKKKMFKIMIQVCSAVSSARARDSSGTDQAAQPVGGTSG